MHHLQLPDLFQDFASIFHCKWQTQRQSVITHCRHELMQGTWKIILDDDFIHACKYGIVVMCIDGIEWRVYPRIFTYSADYPEKFVLSFNSIYKFIHLIHGLEFFWPQFEIMDSFLALDASYRSQTYINSAVPLILLCAVNLFVPLFPIRFRKLEV